MEKRQLLATFLGSEFPVNTTTVGDQFTPQVDAAADGQFVVAWDSVGQDGDGHGVFARRFAADGTANGLEIPVNTTTAGDQLFPSIAVRDDGAFVVVWEGADADGRGIYGRLFDGDGMPLTESFAVNNDPTGDQLRPRVANSDTGEFVVVWTNAGADHADVAMRRFASTGAALDGATQVNETRDGSHLLPAVAMSTDSGFVVTWEYRSAPDALGVVMARKYDANGDGAAPVWVTESLPGDHTQPAVAMNTDVGFVIVWDRDAGGQHELWYRLFSSAAQPVDDAGAVTDTPAVHPLTGSVAMDRQGDFVVVWDVFAKDGDGRGSFGQSFSAAGVAIGDPFQINTTVADDQEQPVTAISAKTNFVVVWDSFGQDGDGRGVFGQRFKFEYLPGSISGYVYADVNDNGVKDNPEVGLPNVPITLSGTTARTVLTDRDGYYQFSDVPPGTYTVTQRQPSAFIDGIDSLGTPSVGAAANNQFTGIQLEPGQDLQLYNFGERGLKPEFITKRLYLALTRDARALIANMDVDDSSTVLTFRPSADGEFTAQADGEGEYWFELYTAEMLPLLIAAPTETPHYAVAEGEQYVLYIGGVGPGEAARLAAKVLLPPPEPDGPCDVNLDGQVTPLDALVVINYLNAHGPSVRDDTMPSLDVNQDNMVSPFDALRVINQLNGVDGEGESDLPITIAASAKVTGDDAQCVPHRAPPSSGIGDTLNGDNDCIESIQDRLSNLPWVMLPAPVHRRLTDHLLTEFDNNDLMTDLAIDDWLLNSDHVRAACGTS